MIAKHLSENEENGSALIGIRYYPSEKKFFWLGDNSMVKYTNFGKLLKVLS